MYHSYRGGEKDVEIVDSCKTKICKFQSSIVGDENVLRFDVSVNNPVAVKEIKTTENLPHQVLDLVLTKTRWRTLGQVCVEVLVEMFKDKVEDHLAIIAMGAVADVLKLDNVWVVVLAQVSQQRYLPQQCHGNPIISLGYSYFLHGNNFIVSQVFSFVNHAIGSYNIGFRKKNNKLLPLSLKHIVLKIIFGQRTCLSLVSSIENTEVKQMINRSQTNRI